MTATKSDHGTDVSQFDPELGLEGRRNRVKFADMMKSPANTQAAQLGCSALPKFSVLGAKPSLNSSKHALSYLLLYREMSDSQARFWKP